MKINKLQILFGYITCVFLLCVIGCSSDRDNPTLPGAHPANWVLASSVDFHGDVVLSGGSAACMECHGEKFDGGLSGVSCMDCHALRTNICTGCHGGINDNSGAPPHGLKGQTSDTSLAVGAHTVHLSGSENAGAVACTDCHRVPAFAFDSLHFDSIAVTGSIITDSIAEIIFSDFSDGSAIWNRDSATCSGTYCHGNFSGGNHANTPIWNGADQSACGSCHDVGTNPSDLQWKHRFHVETAGLICANCHASNVDEVLDIIDPDLHVNGLVEFEISDNAICETCHGSGAGSCTLCHGGTDNLTGAPPEGLDGETLISDLAVGAHTAHLDGGTLSDGIDCSECHIVPTSFSDNGHIDADSTAELNWGTLAGAGSSWDRNNATCSDTYCHGNFTEGHASNQPIWNETNQADCGSCHDVGANPADLQWKHEFHVNTAGLACTECHNNVVDNSLSITGLDLHINGALDTLTRDTAVCNECHNGGTMSCTSCHGGTDNLTGAPPLGLNDETSTNQLAVGAHTIHLEGGDYADAFDCSDCHNVPTNVTDNGHIDPDNIAELSFSALAGGQSTWNRITAECSNLYCHGNFTGGYVNNDPIWTGTDQANCGSCHDVGANPENLSGKHKKHIVDEGLSCRNCHNTTIGQFITIIGKDLHVDGEKTVSLSTTGSYNNGTCSGLPNGCHGSENWYD